MAILGIDPGTRKAGYAVVVDAGSRPLTQGIETVDVLLERLRPLIGEHGITAVALGSGTNAQAMRVRLEALGLPVHLIDERDTTYRARRLYFEDHPRTGWRRWVPQGLQLPPRPIDDYAAILIARRYIRARDLGKPAS